MGKIQIGLVGCGAFGESHLEAFSSLPGGEITAVYDVDRSKAELLAKRFGIDRVCANLTELCQLDHLDAVDIVTDESAHEEGVLAALNEGKHVFVEKPLATDLPACSRMIEAAARANRFLMVGHLLRFETRYAMLKEAIDHGRFGKLVSIHARRNRPRRILEAYHRVHPVLLSCIHDIDYLLWCVGQPVVRVRGYARSGAKGSQFDTFWGILEFHGGVLGIVETHSLVPDQAGINQDDAVQVVGDQGVGKLQLFPGGLSFWTTDGFQLPDVGYDPRVMNARRGALREELAYFVECLRVEQPPTINRGIEGRRAVQVALALIESARQSRDIEIDSWE